MGVAGFKERGGGVGWISLSSTSLLCGPISMSTVGMDDDIWLYAAGLWSKYKTSVDEQQKVKFTSSEQTNQPCFNKEQYLTVVGQAHPHCILGSSRVENDNFTINTCRARLDYNLMEHAPD